jgi:hypothetical protein
MGEKLFRFLLSELGTVRIRCQNGKCPGALEMHVNDLARLPRGLSCPVCQARYIGETAAVPTALEQFGLCLQHVKAQGDRDKFEVEFVFRDRDEPKA